VAGDECQRRQINLHRERNIMKEVIEMNSTQETSNEASVTYFADKIKSEMKNMITEYNTRLFHEPENHEMKSQADELFELAVKDIRYAHNKLFKVQQKVLNPSEDFFKEKTTEKKETLELLSTMYRATIIIELQDVVERATYMLEEFRKHQKNRFAKLDENFEAIANQIEQKRQERENSEDKYRNQIARNCYIDEMRQLEALKHELFHMKEKAQKTYEQDAA
jgi:hypothetical protein